MNSTVKQLAMSLLILVAMCGCASAAGSRPLPYDSWRLGFFARPYMEVWVETADVEDVHGRVFRRAGSGTVALHYSGDPAGWPELPGWGAGRNVTGADLPKRIHVRWQSLVEPQTYKVTLEIPEEARRLMRSKAPSLRDPNRQDYQRALSIGLAPGGVAKVWVMSAGSAPIEVLCQQAEIEPKGPYGGQSDGKHRPLTVRAAPYVQTQPIPYDSWKCPTTP